MKHTGFYGSLAMVIISDFPWEHHHHMIHMLLMFVKQPFPNLSSMGGILYKKPSNYGWFIISIYLLLYPIPEAITPIDTNGIDKISFVNHWGLWFWD